jgi:DNA-binding IclR family transcriptional regulator
LEDRKLSAEKKSSSNVMRAAEILMALGDANPPGLTLSDLATQLDDAKSAVHRALVALGQFGLVEQSGRRGAYRLGPGIYALANKSHSINDMVNFYRPALISISAETGLSSYLMVRSGLDSVCLDFALGTLPMQALFEGVGGRLPLGVGLGGVCVLAQMEEAARDRIIEINTERYGQWGVEADTVMQEITMLKTEGYVFGTRKHGGGGEIKTIAFPAEKANTFNSQAAISLLLPSDTGIADLKTLMRSLQRHLD